MFDLPAILVADGAGVFLMVIVALASSSKLRFRLLDETLFTLMLFFTLLGCALEPSSFVVDGLTGPGMTFLNYLLNSLLFLCSTLFSLLWAIYADYKVYQDTGRLKRVYPFVAIPTLCVIIGLVVNLFTPVFFSISDANVYSRGPFYLLVYLLTYVYLLFGVAMVYRGKGRQQQYMVLPAALFVTPILLGSILQLCFYGLSLVWLGVALAMTTLYISVQSEESAVDQLSGLYSRHYFMNYLQSEFHRSTGGRIRAGITIDVDRFKLINDTYGHLEGDTAIEAFGALLRENVGASGRVARYAGDEFIITLTDADTAEVEQLIGKLHDACKELNESGKYPFQLHFSSGSTLYQGPHDTVDGFLERMDEAMYVNKRERMESNPSLDRRAARK